MVLKKQHEKASTKKKNPSKLIGKEKTKKNDEQGKAKETSKDTQMKR